MQDKSPKTVLPSVRTATGSLKRLFAIIPSNSSFDISPIVSLSDLESVPHSEGKPNLEMISEVQLLPLWQGILSQMDTWRLPVHQAYEAWNGVSGKIGTYHLGCFGSSGQLSYLYHS